MIFNLFNRPIRIIIKLRYYSTMVNFKAVFIDLSGTLHIENDPTPNAIEGLKRLREAGYIIKFVTNTTKDSMNTLFSKLIKIGFQLEKNEIYSSLSAASLYVQANKLNPFYFLSADARNDFPPESSANYDSVVIGLAPDCFNYDYMNKAFKILLENENYPLIGIHQGKYYKKNEKDGLVLGPGCFIKGLEYSTSRTAITIGKPNKYFFEKAIPEGLQPEECCMIGDDINDDIVGAMKCGMKGILVKTGKYLPNVKGEIEPTIVLDDFNTASKWLDEQNKILCA